MKIPFYLLCLSQILPLSFLSAEETAPSKNARSFNRDGESKTYSGTNNKTINVTGDTQATFEKGNNQGTINVSGTSAVASFEDTYPNSPNGIINLSNGCTAYIDYDNHGLINVNNSGSTYIQGKNTGTIKLYGESSLYTLSDNSGSIFVNNNSFFLIPSISDPKSVIVYNNSSQGDLYGDIIYGNITLNNTSELTILFFQVFPASMAT